MRIRPIRAIVGDALANSPPADVAWPDPSESTPHRRGVDVRDQRQTSGPPTVQAQQGCALPKPGDEQCGDYSHARLVRMDNRFRARLLRAFKRGMHETIAEILATQLNRQSRSRKACRRS